MLSQFFFCRARSGDSPRIRLSDSGRMTARHVSIAGSNCNLRMSCQFTILSQLGASTPLTIRHPLFSILATRRRERINARCPRTRSFSRRLVIMRPNTPPPITRLPHQMPRPAFLIVRRRLDQFGPRRRVVNQRHRRSRRISEKNFSLEIPPVSPDRHF